MGLDLGLDEPTITTDVMPSSVRKPLPDIPHIRVIKGFDLEAFRLANNPQLASKPSAGPKETPTRARLKIDTNDEVRACSCQGIFRGNRYRWLRTDLAGVVSLRDERL
jgi:hypothetical protein